MPFKMQRRIFVLAIIVAFSAGSSDVDLSYDMFKVDSPTAKQLLLKIVPQGGLPTLPDGFPPLDQLKTDKFDYKIDNATVTAKVELEDPVSIIGDGMKVHDVKMTFVYNKKGKHRGLWEFNAEGKWRQGNMTARVRIEESKMGKHHTLVAATDWLNVYEVASSISDRQSLETAGINMDVLQSLVLKNAEMYSVFKGGDDYVFMISGTPFLEGTKAKDCKVFVRSLPKKPGVFAVLLEFQQDLPSRVLVKLMSDKLFKIPFINHLIGKTRLFRSSETNFGFVASTGEVEKLPLKSFGEGILSNELDTEISKGLTLLLPIQLGAETDKPVRVAVKIAPPSVTFLTGKHESVSVAQTLKALSPSTEVDVLPFNFPNLSTIRISHFSYEINMESFFVYARVDQEFWAIPGLMRLDSTDVVFQHRVGDQIDTWTVEGTGKSSLGGSEAKISFSTDEDTKVISLTGGSDKMSVAELSRQYNLSFVPDEESRKIVETSKMSDFFFVNPKIKSTTSSKQKNRYIHISGMGHFPGVKRLTEGEAIVYEDKGRLKTAVGFIFPKINMNSLIDAITGFDTRDLQLLKNSFNTSLVLSPENDESLFENPTLAGLSFDRGITMVGLFRIPESCGGNKLCDSLQTMLESDQWYRIQGLMKLTGFNLVGMVDRNYVLGDNLVLKDNMLDFTIGEDSSFVVHSKLKLPKEEITFAGTLNFGNDSVLLDMESDDKLERTFKGGKITVDNLAVKTPVLKVIPLQELKFNGHMTLGEYKSSISRSADATVEYNPVKPLFSRIEAQFDNITIVDLVDALEMSNITVPKALEGAEFTEGFKTVYNPNLGVNKSFEISGRMHIFDKDFDAVMTMNDPQSLVLDTSNSKSPFVLANGAIVLQEDQASSRGGPRLHMTVTPSDTAVNLVGYAKVLGMSSPISIDVTNEGTGFPIYGNLFDVNNVGLLISSRDTLSESETSEYTAYGCLPGITSNITAAVQRFVKAAADEADNFITQANDNLREAKMYYRKASKNEEFFRVNLDKESTMLSKRELEVWTAEEKYNNSCQMGHCKKTCIGCPDWNRCCTRDVFGNCVECPSWNKCCYTTGDPVCVAKNHGCQHIRKVAEGNLDDAKDIYKDQKKHVRSLTKKVFDAEFSKGKTKAVLDAAGKALSLIDRDSRTGIEASKAIKRFGMEGVMNLTSICFNTPIAHLASSCIGMTINATMLDSGVRSLPFRACLNRNFIPSAAHFIANTMFPEIGRTRARRSLMSEERERYYRNDNVVKEELKDVKVRKRRSAGGGEDSKERAKEKIEPFWDLIHQHNPLDDAAKPVPNHPAMGKASLKRKWKIPVSKQGRCKIYHQLLNICRDMMKTVKRMYGTYMYERYLFAKEKDNFRRRLKRVNKQLEESAKLVSGTEDQMTNIERSLNFLSDGVGKWMDKSNKEIKRQEMISVKAWVRGMDTRIKSLGGDGVERFLGNLFKAFDGLFESSNVPSKQSGKALSVMQRVRQIHSAFGEIFKKDITLGRANYYADRVLYDVTEIKDIGVYCKH